MGGSVRPADARTTRAEGSVFVIPSEVEESLTLSSNSLRCLGFTRHDRRRIRRDPACCPQSACPSRTVLGVRAGYFYLSVSQRSRGCRSAGILPVGPPDILS